MKNIALFFVVTLSGCATISPVSIQVNKEPHKIKENPVAYSCNQSHFIEHYNSENRHEIAKKYYKYAAFSSNAYDDNPYIKIPNWERIKRYESWKGFSADVYENKSEKEIVISFRGTEFSHPNDWFFGNFMLYRGGQYKNARDLLELLASDVSYKNFKIIVTGHSLGGGLASHLSAWYEGVNAYVFDPSPRVFAPTASDVKNNKRVFIREKGEVLQFLSYIWRFGIDKLNYDNAPKGYRYDFFKNDALKDHSSYSLARGLILMAAVNNDADAVLVQNTLAKCDFQLSVEGLGKNDEM